MKKNIPMSAVQASMSRIMHDTNSTPWTVGNEIYHMALRGNPECSNTNALESRNKREGKYAGHTSKFFKKVVKAKRGHANVPMEFNYVCGINADCKR